MLQNFAQPLRVETINELEEYFHSKKRITMDAIGREPSPEVIEIYIKGFLR